MGWTAQDFLDASNEALDRGDIELSGRLLQKYRDLLARQSMERIRNKWDKTFREVN